MVTRTCIATGQTLPTNSLIRFVASPDGVAVADLAERLPGRGAWVMADAASISKADSKGHFKRALGVGLANDAEDIGHIVSMLRSRVLSLVAMARRSGVAFAGAGKLLVDGSFDALLAAQDASERECKKLQNKLGVSWVQPVFDSRGTRSDFWTRQYCLCRASGCSSAWRCGIDW
jgi:predicted RNA-binding protein YlxR (DUF448 family)